MAHGRRLAELGNDGKNQKINIFSQKGKLIIDYRLYVSHNGKYKQGDCMRVVSRAALREFWEQPIYQDSEQPLKSWYEEAKNANWQNPQDIKALYRNASFVGNNRVVFNIHGNKYRLIVAVNYKFAMVYVRFVGSHAEYDKVDATTI